VRSDHCPAMKGIETGAPPPPSARAGDGSDHCPAMKGIETRVQGRQRPTQRVGSDHCPAMKGIETPRVRSEPPPKLA